MISPREVLRFRRGEVCEALPLTGKQVLAPQLAARWWLVSFEKRLGGAKIVLTLSPPSLLRCADAEWVRQKQCFKTLRQKSFFRGYYQAKYFGFWIRVSAE